MDLIPGAGRSQVPRSNKACAPQLLSPHPRARGPQPRSLRARSPRSETREAAAASSARSLQPQKAQAKQKDLVRPKINDTEKEKTLHLKNNNNKSNTWLEHILHILD